MKSPDFSRRSFCRYGSSLALAAIFTGGKSGLLHALDAPHTPKLIVPSLTKNGGHVPVAVAMSHPMEPGHYIRRIQILNESDPIPSKGIFHPSPANGEPFFAFQARMHHGTSTVLAVAECSVHGKWSARRQITIPEGQGGCATADGPKEIGSQEEILPPVIRIPELVRRGRLVKDETAEVQVKFKHPSQTGLAYAGKKFIQVEEPFHLTSMQVFYGDRLVSRFEMTAGLSDNPFLKFKLRFTEQRPLRVVFTNSMGRQFVAATEVALS
jgi:sulfur-oxidizing protein SoxY